jgi:hypothetical protein
VRVQSAENVYRTLALVTVRVYVGKTTPIWNGVKSMAASEIVLEVGYRSIKFRTMNNLPVHAVITYQKEIEGNPEAQISAVLTLLLSSMVDGTPEDEEHLNNITVGELTELMQEWMTASA